jgi:hypothetical protein
VLQLKVIITAYPAGNWGSIDSSTIVYIFVSRGGCGISVYERITKLR